MTMAAVVQAIDRFGALMRLAIAAPGNEFRSVVFNFLLVPISKCSK